MKEEEYFRKERKISGCSDPNRFVKTCVGMNKSGPASRAGTEPWRVVVVGDSVVSEQGLVATIGRDLRHHFSSVAHGFYEREDFIALGMTGKLRQSDKGIP